MSFGPLSGQRRLDAGEQLHRAQVDVLVEAEPQFQQQALFEDAGGDVGMADRAEQDGGEGAQLVERLGRQDFAGPQIALAAEIEVLQFELDAFQGGDRLEDLHAFGRHFRPGAVAADHGHAENDLLLAIVVSRCSASSCVLKSERLGQVLRLRRPKGFLMNFLRHSGQRSNRNC